MSTFPRSLIAGAAAIAAAVTLSPALSGCSTGVKEGQSSPPASPGNSQADGHNADAHNADAHNADAHNADAHNDADVMFAQMMIPHHRQALELSALVPERSTDPQVVKLAATIAGEQRPEIDFMTSTLQQWGVNAGGMDHPSGHGGMTMQGMVDEATLVRLKGLTGPQFDTLWLESMISHHQGAIGMARAEVDAGKNPEMTALAGSIITAQQAEIDQMTQMLGGG
jgi:uncharacterized protein (DUF305 family)